MKTLQLSAPIILAFALLFFSPLTNQAQFRFLDKALTKAETLSKKTSSSQPEHKQESKTMNQTQTTPTTGTTVTEGKVWYVSKNTGRGRIGSKEQPSKDLGNIMSQFQPGDVVYVAEGVYTSKGDRGSDMLEVPVSIIGGWDPTFTKRDPWGAHKTILTGTNHIDGETTPRISIETNKKFRSWDGEIVIDGVIVDNGPRNRYKTDKQVLLLRKANPQLSVNATPGGPGIRIRTGSDTRVTVKNCVLTNIGASQGVLHVQLGAGGSGKISNNLIVNNTGNGIYCMTNIHAENGKPQFEVFNNTILFTWKSDAIGSFGGNGLKMDTYTSVNAYQNVLAFSDFGGVDNIKKCKTLTLKDNLITANKLYDYREWNTKMNLNEIEDESEFVSYESVGNTGEAIQVPVSADWTSLYFGRKEISRADVDASAKATNSDANALRSMLGLNLRGNDVSMDADIWLHRISLEDVLKAGATPYHGKYGCSTPR